MAPVKIKFVVSFSSQDAIHTVQNLVKSTGSCKWMSRQKEKTGVIEATFQLEEPCVISSIDIGNCWCATIEIQVGKSDWPLSQSYRVLSPTASLMTPGDCRIGKNSSRQRTLASDDFSSEATKSWDRIRVIMRQPFRKDMQFGLTMLSIHSNEIIEATNTHHEKMEATKFIERQKRLASVQQIKGGSTQSMLQSKLLNIAASSEEGTKSAGSLTRTAKLVLAAADSNIQKYPWMDSPSTKKSTLVSNLATKVQGPSFDEEVSEFLQKFEIMESDLETITVADIRHKFEKKKKRKLTIVEKRLFMDKSKVHICSLFDKDSSTTIPKNMVPASKILPENRKTRPNNNNMATSNKRKTMEPLLPDEGNHPMKRAKMSSPSREDVNPHLESPVSRLCSKSTTNIRNISRECLTPKGIHDKSGDTWLSKDISKEEYSQNKNYRTPSPTAAKKRPATKSVLNSGGIKSAITPGTERQKNSMKSRDIENVTASTKENTSHANKLDSNSCLPVYNTPNKNAINVDAAIVISDTSNCDLVDRFADVPCPLCGRCFPVDIIQIHADICSDPRYGEQVY